MQKTEKDINKFRDTCEEYFRKASLNDLRNYGRLLGMRASTKLKKKELIKEIIGLLTGATEPAPTKRGAPVINNHINPELIEKVECLKREYLHINECKNTGQNAEIKEKDVLDGGRREHRIVIKDTTGKSVSFCGKVLNFQIVIGGEIELLKGETYTICVEEIKT